MVELDEIGRIQDKDDWSGLTESQKIVSKILEYDILDPVWFQVLRNHPELQVRSDGQQAELPRNHALRYAVESTAVSPLRDFQSDVQSVGSDLVLLCDLDGTLSVRRESALGRSLHSLALRADASPPAMCPAACVGDASSLSPAPAVPAPHTEVFPASPFVTKAIFCDPVASSSPTYELREEEEEEALHRRCRQVLLALDLIIEPVTAETIAAAQKAVKAKKDAPLPELRPKKTLRYRVVVVDLFADAHAQQAIIEKIHDFYLSDLSPMSSEGEAVDAQFALFHFLAIDIAEDGQLLSLVVNDSPHALCQIYDTAPPLTKLSIAHLHTANSPMIIPALVSFWKVDAQKNRNDTEGEKENESERSVTLRRLLVVTEKERVFHAPFAPYVTDLQRNEAAKLAAQLAAQRPRTSLLKKTEEATAAPPPSSSPRSAAAATGGNKQNSLPSTAPVAPAAASPAVVSLRRETYSTLRIFLITAHTPFVPIYRLAVKPLESPRPIDPKAKPTDKGKASAEPVPQHYHMLCPCVPFEETRWRFSAPVTAFTFFSTNDGNLVEREYVVIGTRNGTLTVWDVRRNLLAASLGKHPAAITCIAAHYDAHTATVSVLSGSVDGTVTLHANRPVAETQREGEVSFVDLKDTQFLTQSPLYAMKRINYRYDAHRCSAIEVRLLNAKSPQGVTMLLAVVQYSHGTIGVYDCADLSPIGSLAREERTAQGTLSSMFLTAASLPTRRFVFKDPEIDLNAMEAPAPSGKKNAPAVEEINEPEREPAPVVEEKETATTEIPTLSSLQSLVSRGCALSLYRCLISVMRDSILSVNVRHENVVVAVFDMSQAVKQHLKRLSEPKGFSLDLSMAGTSNSRKAAPNTASNTAISKTSRMKGIPLTTNNNNQTASRGILRLTEERLHEHEKQMKNSSSSCSDVVSSKQTIIRKIELPSLDHVALVKKDMLEMKKDRIAGKNKFNKTLNNLINLTSTAQ